MLNDNYYLFDFFPAVDGDDFAVDGDDFAVDGDDFAAISLLAAFAAASI